MKLTLPSIEEGLNGDNDQKDHGKCKIGGRRIWVSERSPGDSRVDHSVLRIFSTTYQEIKQIMLATNKRLPKPIAMLRGQHETQVEAEVLYRQKYRRRSSYPSVLEEG